MDKVSLIQQLSEGTQNFNILGHVCWWNLREVALTRSQLLGYFDQVGLDQKHVPKHNYRAALKRAFNALAEQQLIRPVSENADVLIFQFTAEIAAGTEENPYLTYKPKVTVRVDKDAYRVLENMKEAIVEVKDPNTDQVPPDVDAIKEQIANAFEREKDTYRSSDITRYLQNILSKEADIISLRPQGSIYFVPAIFTEVLNKLKSLVQLIGGVCAFESMPIPDVSDSRKTVKDAFEIEVMDLFSGMEAEIKEAKEKDKEVTDNWVEHRQGQIAKIRKRIEMYSEVLAEKAGELNGKCDRLKDLLVNRELVL
jgi:hypothetical protein